MEKTSQSKLVVHPADYFKKQGRFVMGVAKMEQLPQGNAPEVAFIGRSNVGKSSLINAVTGHPKLARTSKTPGRTQQLNFFTFDESFYLVDFPGYGYAKASKQEINTWNKLMLQYLKGRTQLVRCFVLVDGRHGIKPNDEEMMTLLDEVAVPYEVVLTKADKVKTTELAKIQARTQSKIQNHVAAYPEFVTTSSEKKIGIEQLQRRILLLTEHMEDNTHDDGPPRIDDTP